MNKLAIFRADGAPFMGSGHIMRCLTLADTLRKNGWQSIFISRPFENNFTQAIENSGHELRLLPAPSITPKQEPDPSMEPPHATWLGESWEQDVEQTLALISDDESADLLVVDHYGLDARWHETLRAKADKILVIDDLADRPLDCDILLDQTYGRDPDDYTPLTPEHCLRLTGSEYMLLRDEFAALRQQALEKRSATTSVQNILVMMGSADPDNVTATVLDGLEQIEAPLDIRVILSSKAVHLHEIQKKINGYKHKVEVLQDCPDMAQQMLWADLAYGAGGTTSWERCCLALPTCLISIAENQNIISEKLEKAGAVIYMGAKDEIGAEDIRENHERLTKETQTYKALYDNSAAICDGLGTFRAIKTWTAVNN